jgi:hypothetical protein
MIKAPWTPEQAEKLNEFQRSGRIEIMIDPDNLRCTVCGAKYGACDCWTKCGQPGCKWYYRKGTACRNPEHQNDSETP